ncbi:MAG: hypothetical protein JXR19_09475 [Bacteroidia bacterium]
MKKTSILLSLLMFSTLCWAQGDMPDWATKSGGFGVGLNTTLGISNTVIERNDDNFNRNSRVGLVANFNYAITNALQATALIGFHQSAFSYSWTNNDEYKQKTAGPVFGAGVQQRIFSDPSQRFVLNALLFAILLNGTLTQSESGVSIETEDVSTFSIQLGIEPTYHFTNFFGLHTEVGFVFALVNRSESTFTSRVIPQQQEYTEVNTSVLPVSADLLGSFGFTVWFN